FGNQDLPPFPTRRSSDLASCSDVSVGDGPAAGGDCAGSVHRSLLCGQTLAATWRSRASITPPPTQQTVRSPPPQLSRPRSPWSCTPTAPRSPPVPPAREPSQ